MTFASGREKGAAMILALLAMLVMSALGAALLVAAATESRIARNFRNSAEAFYAADAAVEYAMGELQSTADWSALLDGTSRSSFADGGPHGRRALADGSAIDLDRLVNIANCGRLTTCPDSAMDAVTQERPWGPNNRRWQLFTWGPLSGVMPGAIMSSFYVVVLIADDPSECDDNPMVDGGSMVSCPPGSATNPGAGVVTLRSEAFGPFGSHKTIEVIVARIKIDDGDEQSREGVDTGDDSSVSYNSAVGQAGVRILSWRELRHP